MTEPARILPLPPLAQVSANTSSMGKLVPLVRVLSDEPDPDLEPTIVDEVIFALVDPDEVTLPGRRGPVIDLATVFAPVELPSGPPVARPIAPPAPLAGHTARAAVRASLPPRAAAPVRARRRSRPRSAPALAALLMGPALFWGIAMVAVVFAGRLGFGASRVDPFLATLLGSAVVLLAVQHRWGRRLLGSSVGTRLLVAAWMGFAASALLWPAAVLGGASFEQGLMLQLAVWSVVSFGAAVAVSPWLVLTALPFAAAVPLVPMAAEPLLVVGCVWLVSGGAGALLAPRLR